MLSPFFLFAIPSPHYLASYAELVVALFLSEMLLHAFVCVTMYKRFWEHVCGCACARAFVKWEQDAECDEPLETTKKQRIWKTPLMHTSSSNERISFCTHFPLYFIFSFSVTSMLCNFSLLQPLLLLLARRSGLPCSTRKRRFLYMCT